MAKTISTGSASKVTGETEIRSGNCAKCHIPFEVIEQPDEIPDIRRCPNCGGHVGELLVAFSSGDAETPWGERYEKARIKFAMRNRRKTIPEYLRTGKCPAHLKRTAIWLAVRNLLRR